MSHVVKLFWYVFIIADRVEVSVGFLRAVRPSACSVEGPQCQFDDMSQTERKGKGKPFELRRLPLLVALVDSWIFFRGTLILITRLTDLWNSSGQLCDSTVDQAHVMRAQCASQMNAFSECCNDSIVS